MKGPKIAPELVEERDGALTIRVTALLDKKVVDVDGIEIGKSHDLFAVRDGPRVGRTPSFRIYHLIGGAGAFGDHLGYERQDVIGPLPLRSFFSWLKRRAHGFDWKDIKQISRDEIVLRRKADSLPTVPDLPGPTGTGSKAGEAVYLGLRLLDRQIVDSRGEMTGNVDDLELTLTQDDLPFVSAILAGPGALAHRLGGRLGLWIESVHRRLHPGEGGPARIGFELVTRIGDHVELSARREELEVNRFEEWVRDRFISKIPGA